jgi:hypothetical protein
MPPRPGACQSAWESPRLSLGPTPQAGFPPADRIALTGEVRGFPRLNQRPYEIVQLLQGDRSFG